MQRVGDFDPVGRGARAQVKAPAPRDPCSRLLQDRRAECLDARPEALAGPLWTIAEGLRVIDGDLLDAILSNTRRPPPELLDRLTAQDLKLWGLLATGMETIDIAERMLVSERTAKRMVAALLNKLGVTNRIAAAAMAGRFRLLDDHTDNRLS